MNAQLKSPQTAARFIKIGADGKPLPIEATVADGWQVNTDQRTGLTWVTHAKDLIKVPNFKAPQVKKVKAALAELRLGGFDDWRIPTIEELFLVHDRTRFDPAIDPTFFPDCPIDWFWTNDDYAPIEGFAWYVYSNGGLASGYSRFNNGFVRAVRGGQ